MPFQQSDVGQGSDFEQILSRILQEKLYEKKMNGVGFQDAILLVFKEVLEFSDSIIQDFERDGKSPRVACKSGCSYCCHSLVHIIPIEALLIFQFISVNFTCSEINALRDVISHTRLLTQGKTVAQIYTLKHELPCMFLKHGKCTIYAIRPSICRSWNSMDAKTCRVAYDSFDYKSSVNASPIRNFILGTTRELFEQFSEALLFQSKTLLLHNAVSDCLNSFDPLGLWAKGYRVFSYDKPIKFPAMF